MKKVSIVMALAILFTTSAPTSGQTGVNGTWRAESTPPGATWAVVLRVDGPRLTGAVRGCPSPPVRISEGQIDGNTIKFNCISEDGDRTVKFTGKVNGDEIAFTWEYQLRDGGRPGGANGVVGTSAPPRFIARRVPDVAEADLVEIADQVRGVEFAAAVNLLKKGVNVEGRFFLPQKVGRVRAVIVVSNNGAGQAFYGDSRVRRLLETTQSGIVLARFSHMGPDAIDGQLTQATVDQGGFDGLLMVLQRLAQDSGHRELRDAPLLFWGDSALGQLGATFAMVYPQRTIAFVRYHAVPTAHLDMKLLSQIPALLIVGGKDTTEANVENNQDLWKHGRSVSAPWTFAVAPDATHSSENLKKEDVLVIPWITAVLHQRLPDSGATLRPVSDAAGWMGNTQTGEVAPYATFSGSKPEATWLPDGASAQGWRVVTAKAK